MTPELKAHFLSLYSMALADASFDEKEIAVLYKLGEERGFPKETIDSMLLTPPTPEELNAPNTLAEKIEYLYDYARIIVADGIVHSEEVATLEKFCSKFQFQDQNVPVIAQLLIEAATNNIPENDLIDFVIKNNHSYEV
jgi:uncharacterized tellurite resistance protein B-like protein